MPHCKRFGSGPLVRIALAALLVFAVSACDDGGKNTTYTVTFNFNNGTTPATQTVDAGGSITLPDGSNLYNWGYIFDGWNTKADGTGTNYDAGSSFTPTKSITLYAKWDPVYTVTFGLNGGSGTTPVAQTVDAGSSITFPSGDDLSKTGSTFDGWNTKADGTGDNYDAGTSYTPTGNITFYAKWIPNYNITGTYAFTINNNNCTWLFYSDENYEVTGYNIVGSKSGTWRVSGNEITISYASSSVGGGASASGEETFTIMGSGDQVTLTLKNNSAQTSVLLVSFGLAQNTVSLTRISTETPTFTFSEWEDEITITRYNLYNYNSGYGIHVTIPAEINGKPVVNIGGIGSTLLTSVTIPNSVIRIEENAFAASYDHNTGIHTGRLTSVVIPNSVTFIGKNAFWGNQLTSVTIPNSVTRIEQNAFYGNQLTSVVIPNSVTFIGDWAFYYNQLTSITIGANVTFGGNGFIVESMEFKTAYISTYNKEAGTYTRPNTSSTTWTKQ